MANKYARRLNMSNQTQEAPSTLSNKINDNMGNLGVGSTLKTQLFSPRPDLKRSINLNAINDPQMSPKNINMLGFPHISSQKLPVSQTPML